MSATLESLPTELISSILYYLDLSAIRELSLARSSIRERCAPVLFRRLKISIGHVPDSKFIARYGAYVQHLWFEILERHLDDEAATAWLLVNVDDWNPKVSQDCSKPEEVVPLISATIPFLAGEGLPNLRILTISCAQLVPTLSIRSRCRKKPPAGKLSAPVYDAFPAWWRNSLRDIWSAVCRNRTVTTLNIVELIPHMICAPVSPSIRAFLNRMERIDLSPIARNSRLHEYNDGAETIKALAFAFGHDSSIPPSPSEDEIRQNTCKLLTCTLRHYQMSQHLAKQISNQAHILRSLTLDDCIAFPPPDLTEEDVYQHNSCTWATLFGDIADANPQYLTELVLIKRPVQLCPGGDHWALRRQATLKPALWFSWSRYPVSVADRILFFPNNHRKRGGPVVYSLEDQTSKDTTEDVRQYYRLMALVERNRSRELLK